MAHVWPTPCHISPRDLSGASGYLRLRRNGVKLHGMKPAPNLNTFQPQSWARVVSPVGWAEYSLGADGTLKAELQRGPLIIFSEDGEEKSPVHGPAPTLSALESRVLEVNTRAHFERFRQAARGKVRHSVRWKSKSWNSKRSVIFLGFSNIPIAFRLAGNWNEDIDRSLATPIFNLSHGGKSYQYQPTNIRQFKFACLAFNQFKLLHSFRNVFEAFKREGVEWWTSQLTLSRVELSKVVEPAPRRGRIPRPVHAVPRPPTAPLAPPVTC